MLIKLSPVFVFDDTRIAVEVTGDVVTINGEAFDFGPLEPGGSIPAEAVNTQYFIGDISRDSVGEIVLTLTYPHAPYAPHDSRFPLPISVIEDGPVSLPSPENETEPEGVPEA